MFKVVEIAKLIYHMIMTLTTCAQTVLENSNHSLELICSFSFFESEHKLIEQFESINNRTGTKIIIYNLARWDTVLY